MQMGTSLSIWSGLGYIPRNYLALVDNHRSDQDWSLLSRVGNWSTPSNHHLPLMHNIHIWWMQDVWVLLELSRMATGHAWFIIEEQERATCRTTPQTYHKKPPPPPMAVGKMKSALWESNRSTRPSKRRSFSIDQKKENRRHNPFTNHRRKISLTVWQPYGSYLLTRAATISNRKRHPFLFGPSPRKNQPTTNLHPKPNTLVNKAFALLRLRNRNPSWIYKRRASRYRAVAIIIKIRL